MVSPSIAGQRIGKVRVVQGGVASWSFICQRSVHFHVPPIKVSIERDEVGMTSLAHHILECILMACAGV